MCCLFCWPTQLMRSWGNTCSSCSLREGEAFCCSVSAGLMLALTIGSEVTESVKKVLGQHTWFSVRPGLCLIRGYPPKLGYRPQPQCREPSGQKGMICKIHSKSGEWIGESVACSLLSHWCYSENWVYCKRIKFYCYIHLFLGEFIVLFCLFSQEQSDPRSVVFLNHPGQHENNQKRAVILGHPAL